MKEIPSKDHHSHYSVSHSHSSEISNRKAKKPLNKILKKASNASSTSASDDFSEESSLDLSTISEISDANRKENLDEIFSLEDESSSQMTTEAEKSGVVSRNRFGSNVLDASAITSVEAEIVVAFLKKAQTEILSSADAPTHYHKILDQLINVVIQALSTLPEERDKVAEVLSMKKQVLFFCFLMWIIGVLVVFFFVSDGHKAFGGPLPT